MSVFKRGKVWWYEFWFAGRRIQESTKATSKTVAKLAEQKRRRELEEGFNSIEDRRDERIRTIKEVAKDYLDGYRLRNRSAAFAGHAIGHLTRLLGATMIVDADETMVLGYQEQRLREKAAPKTINEEVGFLLRLLGKRRELIRARLRKQKSLKLKGSKPVAKAYSPEEKQRLVEASRGARSPTIYPALMLALNAGMRSTCVGIRSISKSNSSPSVGARPKPVKAELSPSMLHSLKHCRDTRSGSRFASAESSRIGTSSRSVGRTN